MIALLCSAAYAFFRARTQSVPTAVQPTVAPAIAREPERNPEAEQSVIVAPAAPSEEGSVTNAAAPVVPEQLIPESAFDGRRTYSVSALVEGASEALVGTRISSVQGILIRKGEHVIAVIDDKDSRKTAFCLMDQGGMAISNELYSVDHTVRIQGILRDRGAIPTLGDCSVLPFLDLDVFRSFASIKGERYVYRISPADVITPSSYPDSDLESPEP